MPQVFGVTNRALPSKVADGVQQQMRVGSRGEQYVIPMAQGLYGLVDEGSYFKATNATPGTGIIHALTTAFSATAALLCLRNTDTEGAKRVYMDYIRIVTGATAISMTAATSIEMAVTVDNTNRYSSGGTSITPVNANMDSAQGSIVNLNFGAVVLAAASGSVRLLSRAACVRRAAPAMVTGDQFLIDFGVVTVQTLAVAGAAAPATAATAYTIHLGPVIIGGGDSLNFHLWYPAGATTAPTFEFEIGWWER